MGKRLWIIAGVTALLLAGSVFALVKHERTLHNRSFSDRIVERLTRRLDLTEAQQTQVRGILAAQQQNVSSLLAQAHKNHDQLRSATTGGEFDEAQVRAIASQQAQTMTDLIVVKERVKAKIYNEVLTSEQRAKADQFLEHLDERFARGFHERAAATIPVVP